jgi:hypothetical protein
MGAAVFRAVCSVMSPFPPQRAERLAGLNVAAAEKI